ncbi:glycosyltransferase [Ruegeria hyattellae]|uniref:glycosyltransferase n=1 Tax=Ruegeria hyattellae TaxID=3233337 RepID=UPI00355C0EB2
MHILLYNWVDYLDDEKRGGGVSVYLRNLMTALGSRERVRPVFLSSGISYDLVARKPRWERMRHGSEENRENRYEIVNSGVLSPSHHSFGNPAQLSHGPTRDAFFDFVEKTGPYDVIHFHNLEGLPADVLEIKARFPDTKVILSLHNYYPVCPQVNLWHQEKRACSDFEGGAKCGACLVHKHDERLIRVANSVAYRLKRAGIRPGMRSFDLLFRQLFRIAHRTGRFAGRLQRSLRRTPAVAQAHASGFADRRQGMIDQINANCDLVLGVSDRVCEIARVYGVRPEILRTSYIGTKQAEAFAETRPAATLPKSKTALTLGFLGYMRRDKGFFFLLDTLEALPPELAAQVRLVVAARTGETEAMRRLELLKVRLGSVAHLDGYSHDGLDDLLRDVDVGLIPVLWEDNLPQVAIEMHARHIPLLTSDMGGARELAGCPDMVFAAGDTDSFADRIRALLAGEVDLERYWQDANAPQTMTGHLDDLKRLYSREKVAVPATKSSVLKATVL